MTIGIFNNFKTPVLIDGLEIDTTLREVHSYRNIVTEYPIESGANITDHVKSLPERLVIDSMTTNTPIVFLADAFSNLLREDGSNRIQLAYNVLLRWAGFEPPKQEGIEPEIVAAPAILTIVTGLKVFTNMVIVNLEFPKTKETGESVQYTIEFKKIKRVEAEFTQVQKTDDLNGKAPNVQNQAAKTANTGVDKATEVQEVQESTALKIIRSAKNGITGLFQ